MASQVWYFTRLMETLLVKSSMLLKESLEYVGNGNLIFLVNFVASQKTI